MPVPSDPPAVTPAGFQTWAQNVSDTAQDHDTRITDVEAASGTHAPAASRATYQDQSIRKTGDVIINTTSFVAVDSALDLTLTAAVGDRILIGANGMWKNEAINGRLDFAVWDGSVIVRRVGAGAAGLTGGSGIASSFYPVNPAAWLTVTVGDLVGSEITLRLLARTDTAGNKTLLASNFSPLFFWARNGG